MTTTLATRPARPARAARPVRPVPVAAAPVRLTRRGRAVVVLLLLAVLLVVGFALGRASESHAAIGTQTAVVHPGDTLWSIATRVAPDRDTRQVVAAITAANHLDGASLQVGQRLVVPA